MDNWHPTMIHQVLDARQRDWVARGEAAQRLAEALDAPSARARLAGALVALAARLDPAGYPTTGPEAAPTLGSPAA